LNWGCGDKHRNCDFAASLDDCGKAYECPNECLSEFSISSRIPLNVSGNILEEIRNMRNLAIITDQARNEILNNPSLSTLDFHGVPIHGCLLSTPAPAFEAASETHRSRVLVRIIGFSCNYRDQNMLFATMRKQEAAYYVIGSEFTGEVVDVGASVASLSVGDRVIGNNAFSGFRPNGRLQGLPTNHGSAEYQIIHESKLIRIPENMPPEIAAAFSVGAQTTYSMLRKLQIGSGDNILITAACSNTSLFAIQALKNYAVNVYALTTSDRHRSQLEKLNIREIVTVQPGAEENSFNRVTGLANEIGGFDCVIDPFFDIYLPLAVAVMAPGGRYTSCGLWKQYAIPGDSAPQANQSYTHVMSQAMINNLQIIGNCLGTSDDLARALADYAAGKLDITLDSVFSGYDVGRFLERTYLDRERFGKVAFLYD
jgi:NADPH:quinone reductase-like Zn-dependent oxidoreductase